ncbi:efflux RND transporter periplasmic adaptor subunit [Nitrogeniibacter mangrovi]|nr:efflux RND transporter periplasmic adaptor subunit [Nitrogeniibacter mangrovi]
MKIRQTFLLLIAVVAFPVHAEPVATAPVERAPVASQHVAEGVVEAVTSATVAAQVQGRILATPVDAGDTVRRGQVLMRVDAAEANQSVAAAVANVARAQAAYANARAEWERTQALFNQKFVSQAHVDQAQAALRAAEASLKAAQAGRGQAVVARDFTTITAPFDGIVAVRHVDAGDMAQPGRALIDVYAPGAMRVVAQVPLSVIGRAGNGQLRAQLEVPALNLKVAAERVTVLPAADPRTFTVEVRATVPAATKGLVPGQFARMHLFVGESARVTIPASAVLRRGEITAVYVKTGDGFHLRQIRPGESVADGRIEVLAGLKDGEQVALDPIRASLTLKAPTAD